MKNFMIFAALLAAVAARGAIPETAEGWYTPPADWKPKGVDGTWEKYGKDYGVEINAEGELVWYETSGVSAAEQVALEVAVRAFWNTQWNTQYIKTLGNNLHAVMSTDGITLSGTDPNGNPVRYTLKFSSGVGTGTGTTIEATDPSLSYKHTDERSLRWTGANKAEIYGWSSQSTIGSAWAKYLTPYSIPTRNPSGNLAYLGWYGVDNLSLAPSASGPLELKGWSTAGATMTPLADAMTAEDGVFDDYELVVRNASKGLNFVSVGNLSQLAADGEAIIEKEDGVITIAGYPSATEGQVLTHTGSGVTWTEPTGTEYTAGDGIIINEDADEPTISVDPEYLDSAVGGKTAVDGTFLYRDENDVITVNTNVIVQASVDAAVAEMPVADGVSIIEKEDYTLTIAGYADAADGAVLEKAVNGVQWVEKQTIQIVTDVRLDASTQKLQKKTAYLTFVGILDEESGWEDL